MNNSNARAFSIIGAVCFLIVIVYNLFNGFTYVFNLVNRGVDSWIVQYAVVILFNVICALLLAIALLIGQKNKLILVAMAVRVVSQIIRCIMYKMISVNNVLGILAGIVGVVACIMYINDVKIEKSIKIVACFIPVIYEVFSEVIWLIRFFNLSFGVLIDIIYIAGLAMIALWLINLDNESNAYMQFVDSAQNVAYANNAYNGYQQPVYGANLIGGADKIREYKRMLDSGIITYEEYEIKKREALGL